MSLAWHIEMLARQERLPRLAALMTKKKTKARPQTAAEIEAATRSWLASSHRQRRLPASAPLDRKGS